VTLPTFLGIGVPRGGTTWLHELLAAHPDVYMPSRRKELNFFNFNYSRGVPWYQKFFPNDAAAGAYKAIGEISPWYFYADECPSRISGLGIEKLILMLRNPTDRTWSYYARAIRDGDFRGSFEEFLEHPRWQALEQGRYARYLQGFLEHFRSDQILVLISECAFGDLSGTKRRLGEFLGVAPDGFGSGAGVVPVNASYVPRAPRAYALAFRVARHLRRRLDLDWLVNTGKRMGIKRALGGDGRKLPPMSEQTRRHLASTFAPGIDELQRMLQASLAVWR
jgi:hypothetical protein